MEEWIQEQRAKAKYWQEKIDEIKSMKDYQLSHLIQLASSELDKRICKR